MIPVSLGPGVDERDLTSPPTISPRPASSSSTPKARELIPTASSSSKLPHIAPPYPALVLTCPCPCPCNSDGDGDEGIGN